MASLGDSISRGFNALSFLANPHLSWSSGKGPLEKEALWIENFSSHYLKLKKMFPKKEVKSFNLAISGTRSRSLKWQIRRLLRKNEKIDYVTILTGANDLCRMSSNFDKGLNKIKNNVRNAVKKLVDHNKEIKITLVPLPDFFSLYDSLKDNKSCRVKWNIYPLCKVYLHSKRTEKQRDEFLDRVEVTNNNFQEIANEFKENVKYNKSLGDIEFGEESISKKDCFHPSVHGQSLISEYTWDPEFVLGRELTPGEDFY